MTTSYAYTYDETGRLLTVTKGGVLTEEYQYNENGSRVYEMNAARGIAGRSLDYSNEDHLLTAGNAVYDYDLDGFLTTKTEGTDVTAYDYSSRGELLGVNLPDGTLVEFLHDPTGRRIAKKVNGVLTEKYLWSGLTKLLAVYDGSDNLKMRFEYADGRMPFAVVKGGVRYYLAYDQVGSLRVVADASGNMVKQVEYDTFGNVLIDSAPLFEVPFGFAGGFYDRDVGLVRFGYRDYDPGVGRWTAKDPIGFGGGDVDLFGYCQNDPVNFVDLLGLSYGESYNKNFKATNKFFFQGIGNATKTAIGFITSGSVARTFGTVTPIQAIASIPKGGITTLGPTGTALAAVANTAMNAVLSAIALESGISVGSLINAMPVYGSDETLGDWWVDFILDYMNNMPKETPCSE